jgi:hypothetical protein
MHEKVITIYCLCADFLSAWGIVDDVQSQMSTAEVMTVALVAAALFTGNQERGRLFLSAFGFIPAGRMLSKGRLNRRLHAIDEGVWQALFALLAEAHKQANGAQGYVVDSLPVPVCDNYRIIRCRLYPLSRPVQSSQSSQGGATYRGRIASKRRYFYGLRVHLVITASGGPVEFCLAPGSVADVRAFQQMELDLPEGACLYADPAYTDYEQEDLLAEAGVRLVAGRKKNSKRPHPPWVQYVCEQTRKRVETTFSLITEQSSA